MGRRLMLILTCALIVGLALPAFAEVQNVKVSGDINMMGISRSYFNSDAVGAAAINKDDDKESHAATIMRLRFDADLTENVSTTFRLINERDWTAELATTEEISVDLASITLKEFLYSPLTMIIGRQELHFGNDLIIGDPDTNRVSVGTSLTDQDLTSKKAFDAVRATLDYDPLVIDIIWAKIQEGTVVGARAPGNNEKDDEDLWGINARWDVGGNWNIINELYLFRKTDRSATANEQKEVINNIGVRTEMSPKERLMLQGEVAFQNGRRRETAVANDNLNLLVNHQAWAGQLIATYVYDMKYNPVLTGSYSYFSGDPDTISATTDSNSSRAWDPMYENQTAGHIANIMIAPANLHVYDLRGTITPMEDLALTLDLSWYQFAETYSRGDVITTGTPNGLTATHTMTGDDHAGSEVDVILTYDYTEDVQLSLLGGMFFPGDAFDSGDVANTRELIASVKVEF